MANAIDGSVGHNSQEPNVRTLGANPMGYTPTQLDTLHKERYAIRLAQGGGRPCAFGDLMPRAARQFNQGPNT